MAPSFSKMVAVLSLGSALSVSAASTTAGSATSTVAQAVTTIEIALPAVPTNLSKIVSQMGGTLVSAESSPTSTPDQTTNPLRGTNSTGGGTASALPLGYQNIAYFATWDIYHGYQPQQIPAKQLTHIIHSFANVSSAGLVASSDPWGDYQNKTAADAKETTKGTNAYGVVKQLYLLKKANPTLKVMLSVGGYGEETRKNFATLSADSTARKQFASSAVKLVTDWGYDGIDVDWESPESATEGENFALLLQTIRDELDVYSKENADGYHFQLSIASPAAVSNIKNLPLKKIAGIIDFYNLMAYDYTGSWSNVTGHHANANLDTKTPATTPFSTNSSLAAYVKAGVPAAQVILGMPLYGRMFNGTAGLGKTFDKSSGVAVNYNKLPLDSGAKESFDSTALAAYSYSSANGGELVSYDSPESVKAKINELVFEGGMGGSMFWEISGDKTGSDSLVAASYEALQQNGGALSATKNLLKYPKSSFDNIKNNME